MNPQVWIVCFGLWGDCQPLHDMPAFTNESGCILARRITFGDLAEDLKLQCIRIPVQSNVHD
jgi:hypothetical protein